MKLWIDHERCDGFGRCVDYAPTVFTTPEDPHFRTELLMTDIPADLEGRVIAAIQRCPKIALHTDLDIDI